MIDWTKIRTVLLDMDGTLLDLYFDTHFWQEHLPQRFADKHGLSLAEAKAELEPRFASVRGTMNWYCVDYWTAELGLDIALLKEEVAHLIALHPHVLEFLHAVRAAGRRAVLVTNAHGKSLALKMRQTRLGEHLDAIVCAHDIGIPKENPAFWRHLQRRQRFEPQSTLLIDDNLDVLRSAQSFGIAQLLAVVQPDSSRGPLARSGFAQLTGFREIMPPSE